MTSLSTTTPSMATPIPATMRTKRKISMFKKIESDPPHPVHLLITLKAENPM